MRVFGRIENRVFRAPCTAKRGSCWERAPPLSIELVLVLDTLKLGTDCTVTAGDITLRGPAAVDVPLVVEAASLAKAYVACFMHIATET